MAAKLDGPVDSPVAVRNGRVNASRKVPLRKLDAHLKANVNTKKKYETVKGTHTEFMCPTRQGQALRLHSLEAGQHTLTSASANSSSTKDLNTGSKPAVRVHGYGVAAQVTIGMGQRHATPGASQRVRRLEFGCARVGSRPAALCTYR